MNSFGTGDVETLDVICGLLGLLQCILMMEFGVSKHFWLWRDINVKSNL